MKIVIALVASPNLGKTSTLRELAKLLLDWKSYPKTDVYLDSNKIKDDSYGSEIPNDRDFRLTMKINNYKIGIATGGDAKTQTSDNITHLLKAPEPCNIVFIAVRINKGAESLDTLREEVKKLEYNITETSPFSSKEQSKEQNAIKARRLLSIAKSLVEINQLYF